MTAIFSSRRNFLKAAAPISLMVSAAILGYRSSDSLAQGYCANPFKDFNGEDLADWELVVGDGNYVRPDDSPVTDDDITLVQEEGYSEIQSNIRLRPIQAHAIAFNRYSDSNQDTLWAQRALQCIHTCGYKFRLPYIPSPNLDSEFLGETIEGGLFVWDGRKSRLDYGIAYQWIVSPRNDDEFGQIRTWDGTGWVPVGNLPIDQKYHSVTMTVDFARRTTALLIDQQPYSAQFSQTQRSTDWGIETAARLQAEIISIHPEPEGLQKLHKAEFKDWFWVWEQPTHQVCMPLIFNAETPTPTHTPEPTPSSCSEARITSPTQGQTVSSPVKVEWAPCTCSLVLQMYQNGNSEPICEKGKDGGVPCGTECTVPPGETQIKIWIPGASTPLDEIWITVSGEE